ncbi:class F sortase [Geodermatophilus sabuli]|uniref:Sortase family protein n=1 Tax=Geodermatophilus sabuli TaxID=1564158 RepID=A0A285EGL1_9ACTN|nr:class F sortase [Geodermatophilus sabuli]MBB3085916.1 sortase (surface protein transpeptidase) [Geodermatophilus sabuli]SNX98258.1 Sortase family protein [Geodermatophilus sabuli]
MSGGLAAVRRLLAATALVAGAVALVAPAPTVPPTRPVPVLAESGAVAAAAAPLRVRVPAIGVDSPLARLGVDATGALVPPAEYDRAGWFTGSPAPGDVGPAVVAGHLDSRAGPAVFWRLRELAAGDEVLVDRGDGTTVRFVVTAVATYPKEQFPTAAVYGPTPRAELRLVTCGGEFDRSARSYADNVVVTAVLALP